MPTYQFPKTYQGSIGRIHWPTVEELPTVVAGIMRNKQDWLAAEYDRSESYSRAVSWLIKRTIEVAHVNKSCTPRPS
jgi:hypothetical protein